MMHTIFNATFNTKPIVVLQCAKSMQLLHILTLFSHNKELRYILSIETYYLHYKIISQLYTFL
jgi:hypothetical protein